MRVEKLVGIHEEYALLDAVADLLIGDGFHAGNSVIVTVSTDYSSVVGQYLRHELSHDRDICEGFGIDVPYPDETWDDSYVNRLNKVVDTHSDLIDSNKVLILVEAGVIRGGNYTYLVDYFRKICDNEIVTMALFENKHSRFKSDYVGEYYDNETEDLTFWWEQDNRHWDNA